MGGETGAMNAARALFGLAFAAGLLAAWPARGEPPVDRATLPSMAQSEAFTQCLDEQKPSRIACLGRIQRACLNADDAAATTYGAVLCAERERTLWARWGEAAAQALRADPHRRAFLKKAETAWATYRDAECAYEASIYLGGSLAKVVSADCRLRLTATHAIDLNREYYRTTHEGADEPG